MDRLLTYYQIKRPVALSAFTVLLVSIVDLGVPQTTVSQTALAQVSSSSSPTTTITTCDKLPIVNVTASGFESLNIPANVLYNNLSPTNKKHAHIYIKLLETYFNKYSRYEVLFLYHIYHNMLYTAMSSNSKTDQTSNNGNNNRLAKEIIILSSIFFALLILAIRPFGFRTFLHGLQHDSIFSLLLVASAVGVVLVMMQRLG